MKYPIAGAPERVETALLASFRKHHRTRRLRRAYAAILAVGAAACLSLTVRIPKEAGPPDAIVFYAPPPAMAWAKTRSVQPKAAPVHKPTSKPPTDRLAMTDFVALPYGDFAMMQESATVVRVELPRSALRLAGFNVAEEHANDPVQADVVLGADGLAHAVRFVTYRQ